MSRYYSRDGHPITIDQWVQAFNDNSLLHDQINDDVRVSTIYLGLDHSFGEGPPLIYETMIFGGEFDSDCERYTTEAQAREGHAAMLAKAREGVVVAKRGWRVEP